MKILVLKLDDTKVDNQHHIMPTNAEVEMKEFVPLLLNFDKSKTIGSAKINREGNEFFITDIQGIDIEQLKLLTPAIGGRIIKTEQIEENSYIRRINSFGVDEVSFQLAPNCDDAIKSVGEQLNDVK